MFKSQTNSQQPVIGVNEIGRTDGYGNRQRRKSVLLYNFHIFSRNKYQEYILGVKAAGA
jgi:hypothetical protein